MASGITVDDDCKTVFEAIKLKHTNPYVVYRISEDLKRVEIDYKADKGESYSSFVERMKEASDQNQGRYAVVDIDVGKGASKLAFILWANENIPIKQKMIYTATKRALMDKLNGVTKEFQCNDLDDLDLEALLGKLQSKY